MLLLSKTYPFFLSFINSAGPVLQLDANTKVLQNNASTRTKPGSSQREVNIKKSAFFKYL